MNEFPRAAADGGGGGPALIPVVGILPEDRTVRRGTAAENRHEADSVENLTWGGFRAGGFEECRKKIRARDGRGDHGARFHRTRPADEEGLADAAFIHPALATAQRQIGGGPTFARGETAVVTRENDDRVFGETEGVELREDFADREVHGLDHASVNRVVLREADIALPFPSPFLCEAEARPLVFIFRFEIGARHERRVDGIERKVGEEGAVFVCRDERGGFGREAVREVFARRAVGQAGVVVGRKIFVAAVGSALVDTAEVVVETLIFRPPALGSEVPLASEEGGVAGGFQ